MRMHPRETSAPAGEGYDPIKRILDFILGSLLFVLTLPIQAIVGCLVRVNLGSPVVFKQERPGKDGRVFTLRKFRTMVDADPEVGLVADEARITPLGAKLRSTSLDELPTLWNVVKGDMSLVGPRPLLVKYLDRYTSEQARRHEVRPGVTGLAQVSGRNSLTWEEKFDLDVEYVENRSLSLDCKILCRTVTAVFARRGISHDDHVTMHEFVG